MMYLFKQDVKFKSEYIDASKGGSLYVGHYVDATGCLVMVVNHETNVLSTNLSEYGIESGEGYFYIKNYGEHEGLVKAMVDAGLILEMGEYKINYGTFTEVYLVGWDEWTEKGRYEL